MFGHKDLNHAADGNYALVQSNVGDTFLGATSAKSIFIKNGTTFIGKFDNDNIELTGDTSTSTATVIGNSYGLSYTNIYSGLFGTTLSGSATTTITGSTSGQADAYIGSAEVGTHPYAGRNYAMFGHKDLDHSTDGNYALVQSNVGDTFLGAVADKIIYFKNGTKSLGSFYYSNFFAKTIFLLDGATGSPTAVTLGSTHTTSNTTINAGSGGIILSGSATTIITGSTSGQADAYIGTVEIGELPATKISFPAVYAMFGHKALDHNTDGNYALVQSNVGDTFLGAASTKSVVFKNGTSIIGYLDDNEISLTGKPSTAQTVTLGSTTGASSLTLNAGTGGITKPNQPAFLAYMSGNQNNFAFNTDVTVLFNSEVFDQAGNFNTAAYIFTAPVTGRYIFNIAVRLQTVDILANYYTTSLVTSNRTYRVGIIEPNFSANLTYFYLNGSVVADMDTSDTAYVTIHQSAGTTGTTDIISGNNSPVIDSYFSGYLLG